MEKKNFLLVAVFLLILTFLVIVGYQVYIQLQEDKQEDTNTVQTITEDSLTFEYTYKGDNLWGYTVKGELPNQCYKISTDALVAESYPEQVYVTSTITPPAGDEICTQVIQEVNEIGEFNASEDATVSFKVVTK